jgi:hypothetical protein
MDLLKPKIKDYPGKYIQLKIDNPNLEIPPAVNLLLIVFTNLYS